MWLQEISIILQWKVSGNFEGGGVLKVKVVKGFSMKVNDIHVSKRTKKEQHNFFY